MSTFVEGSFTNEFGQVVQPGDEVFFMATSWGSTDGRLGIYKGYYDCGELRQRRHNPETKQWEYVTLPYHKPLVLSEKKYSWWTGRSILELGRIYKLEK